MTQMILLLYSFTVISGMGAWVLHRAESGTEMFFAALFAPVAIHMASRILGTIWQIFIPERENAVEYNSASDLPGEHTAQSLQNFTADAPMLAHTQSKAQDQSIITRLKRAPETGSARIDVDRRLFLKLIGSAGVSVFMMSLFTRKAQAAFFGSLPGSSAIQIKNASGVKIDPKQEHPTDGYEVSEIDDATAPAYYGFMNATGAWYITREDSTGSYRYAKGNSSFSTNWTGRALLSYDYYDNVF